MAVHFDDRTASLCCHATNPIGPRGKWKEVGDDHAGLLCKSGHNGRAVTFTCQMEGITNALPFKPSVHVYRRIENHVVVTQRGVRIAFVKSVIHQELPFLMVGYPSPNIHCWMFMCSKRGLQPDDNGSFSGGSLPFREPLTPFSQVGGQVHACTVIFATLILLFSSNRAGSIPERLRPFASLYRSTSGLSRRS